MFPYWKYDGMALADLIRRKEIQRTEVIQAAISRIEAYNPSLNAVIHRVPLALNRHIRTNIR